MDKVDLTIIGAGLIGLAIARRLAPLFGTTLILEQAGQPGTGISSRNSEVIHAGIYYPSESLKAKFCTTGKELLYRYCHDRHIAHRRIGKLLVAQNNDELTALQQLERLAASNGVSDLQWLEGKELHQKEPLLQAMTALYSPSTGIIDSHQLMLSLLNEAQADGAQLVCNSPVTGITPLKAQFIVDINADNRPFQFQSRIVINAAGLGAQQIAHSIQGMESQLIPPLHYCKGSYFDYTSKAPFQHLIYPIPPANTTGLGIHATLDLAGQMRFGPDVEFLEDIEFAGRNSSKQDTQQRGSTVNSDLYRVSEKRKQLFQEAIRRYYPTLNPDKLVPAYAGIRPKLTHAAGTSQDFIIQSARQHHHPGLIQLFGIESPGLTSCLAIADHVADILALETA